MNPTGIKFPHGVPRGLKQFSVVQPEVHLPPSRSKPKAQPARGGGYGARPKRGGGFTASPPSASRYLYYQSDEAKSENEPNSSKKSDFDVEACAHCQRSRTKVYCWHCGFERSNLRVSKACPRHLNVRFLYDMVECPACLTKSLAEEDCKMTD